MFRHPGLYARLLNSVLQSGSQLPRPVVRGYLRAPLMFRKAPPIAVARDLLRFAMLQRFLLSRTDAGSALFSYDAATSTLVVEAPHATRIALPGNISITGLCWRYGGEDPSGVPLLPGQPAPRIEVAPDEPWTFSALAALARRYPREMSRFFESLIPES
jgi:hypothetical protein